MSCKNHNIDFELNRGANAFHSKLVITLLIKSLSNNLSKYLVLSKIISPVRFFVFVLFLYISIYDEFLKIVTQNHLSFITAAVI